MDQRRLIAGTPELWDDNSATSSHAPPYALALINELSVKGLVRDSRLQSRIVRRIEHLGCLEAARLSLASLTGMNPAKVRWVLGSGFTMTEFLIAPVIGAASPPAICSLGALVNLMVVLCDRLLDAGTPVDDILPSSGRRSPVFDLLDAYRVEFAAVQPTHSLYALSEKLIARMIDSERQTVFARDRLPYRHWFRKSAFPIVLMALAAWTCRECAAHTRSNMTFSRHLRWLCRVGLFFGVLDDAADYERDIASAQPNCFRSRSTAEGNRLCRRAASWGTAILADWSEFAGGSAKAVLFKETFLNLTWAWLKPAAATPP